MFDQVFAKIYMKFKLNFYREAATASQGKSDSLTAMESCCMEGSIALGEPTVNAFAQFLQISSPNATYKINHLIKKGYLPKVRSENDRRAYHLHVTPKYVVQYNNTNHYFLDVMSRIKDRFTPEELEGFQHILHIVNDELMNDLPNPDTQIYTGKIK